MGNSIFPSPQRGASLVLAFHAQNVLIIGSGKLAATRAFAALESDSNVTVVASGGVSNACEELKYRASNHELDIFDFGDVAGPSGLHGESDLAAIQAFLDSRKVSLVCVTDTLLDTAAVCRRSRSSATRIHQLCKERNIPVNITDMPDLCDFTFCATHRFSDPVTGEATPLQVGVTTNGQGCRLAGRIRRDIVGKLPAESGAAVAKVGRLRKLAKRSGVDSESVEDELNDEMTVSSPNRPVQQRTSNATESEVDGAK